MEPNRKKIAAAWFYSQVYRDEQILPRENAPREQIPEEIRAMRAIEQAPDSRCLSREEIFVRQGRLMAAYTDEYSYDRDVIRFFPTYQSFTDRELRGYFSWRSAWRRGEKNKTSLSFAFLYIYELLNQIGVTDPIDGYETLKAFAEAYGELDKKIRYYADQWLWDYVVYYGLDPVLLSGRSECRFDEQLNILITPEGRTAENILEAAMELSSYRLERSRLYAKDPDALADVTASVWQRMGEYYGKHRKQSLTDDFFGPITCRPIELFHSAVFLGRPEKRDKDYVVDSLRSYHCHLGKWSVRQPDTVTARSKKMSDLLRTIDSLLREELGYDSSVQAGLSTKWILQIIREEIAAYKQKKQKEEARQVHIDYSKLSGIRSDSVITREKLIVDEETEEEPQPEVETAGPASLEGFDLTEDEHRFLCCLLRGESVQWIREKGLMLSVLLDGINEKLFDVFGDTVLDDTSDVIEDYRDELKEILKL